jgi:hypothetical protein
MGRKGVRRREKRKRVEERSGTRKRTWKGGEGSVFRAAKEAAEN